uniref:RNA polymerase II subunit A C-terminal domain phosphatase SSU72 n=1 Tax=Loxodonta africana TaxID=9785 RepID=G3U3N1_LOXAF
MSSSPLRLAVVCMSNINRSMEVHSILKKKGLCVRSFGTGSRVKLPGPEPNFFTTYQQMYDDLLRKDRKYYMQNGMIHILGKSQRIKPQPERLNAFNVIVTHEETVYDRVVGERTQPVRVINVDVEDTLDLNATLGAFLICELCQLIQYADDMEDSLNELLLELEEKIGKFLHSCCFY